MTQEKNFDPEKSESLSRQFLRFAVRQKNRLTMAPMTIDDVSLIKLPAVDFYCYGDDNTVSYYATRNAGGKWNVAQQDHQPNAPLGLQKIATELCLSQALDLLAEKNPAGMEINRHKNWHPVSVAKRAGHTFKKDRKSAPSVPKAAA